MLGQIVWAYISCVEETENFRLGLQGKVRVLALEELRNE